MKVSHWVASVSAAIVFSLGMGTGWWLTTTFEQESGYAGLHADIRDKFSSSQFTNPLLECAEISKPITIGARIDLEEQIEVFIKSEKSKGHISEAAVYYRDLNNGPWFGVNEDLEFYPASLYKIPLAMWFYWTADTQPDILAQEIEFVGPKGASIVHFEPKKSIVVGETYTVEELIKYMLQESDNDAAHILNEFAGPVETQRVYADLGIFDSVNNSKLKIDVRTYSSFFRVLYNATYLGRSLSEHILQIMSESSFTQGIVSGVPKGVVVSHKFGEKILDTQGTQFQLHDCGIVYAEKSPYILCVMTQGSNVPLLATFIGSVSEQVYESVR